MQNQVEFVIKPEEIIACKLGGEANVICITDDGVAHHAGMFVVPMLLPVNAGSDVYWDFNAMIAVGDMGVIGAIRMGRLVRDNGDGTAVVELQPNDPDLQRKLRALR